MKPFETHFPMLLLLGSILSTCGDVPAFASSISATISATGQTQQNTGVSGQVLTLGSSVGPFFVEAETAYGLDRAYARSSATNFFTQGLSSWSVDFTLSGGTMGTFVPLTIIYSFDAVLAPSINITNFGYNLFGGAGNVPTIFAITAQTAGSGTFDQCFTKFGAGIAPAGFCAGAYSSSASVLVSNAFQIGPFNHLDSSLVVNAENGTVDAFSTSRILGIVVPDGVTWTYGPGITGNPLNFQSASDVPEPSTCGLIGMSMAVLIFRRWRIA